ncbi:MAG: PAS domain-containing protein [Proteobacteria bacterium]|nr:PAS domain-containing protein [Pseudomonadota bacterium]MBU1714599.1 PAS domain-containing protein [Pseudomonadota bacterium]
MSSGPFDKADQSREFLFTVIESLPNGIILADNTGSLLTINQQARNILGLSGVSTPNLSCWEILKNKLGLSESELTIIKKGGERLLIEVGADSSPEGKRCISIIRNELKSPFRDISGFFLIFDDVTYPSMVKSQVDRQRRMTAMQEMAISMSQELKNPLGGLELYASILKRELQNDPDNERVTGQMMQAIRTMDCILNNYVTFSRLPVPKPATINITSWLEETISQLQMFSRKISFVCRFGHQEEKIIGDAELLSQLSLNIGLNGVESMADGGEFSIETRTSYPFGNGRAFLEIRFTDQGEGITEENLEKIFDPFFNTRGRGSGLGLATVHHIVEVHNGLVKVETKPGKGSTFIVLLPWIVPESC